MTTYRRFEELPVWQAAIELGVKTHETTAKPAFRGQASLRDQLGRAAVSVSNNIAEGFERGTTQELMNFLYVARGAAGEVRSMLWLMERMPGFKDLKSEISDLRLRAEGISRQLRGWAEALQNSSIPGPKYLNEKSRLRDRARKEREEFVDSLKQSVAQLPGKECKS